MSSNKYELTCTYCGHSWGINYVPSSKVYCNICKDPNITAIDLQKDKIDYYAGSPLFEEVKEPFDKDWNY